jgi:endogenous inhibitor of DNA gyrase (YacG/DUF329 family)
MPNHTSSPPGSDPQGSAGDRGGVKPTPTCPVCGQPYTPPYNHPRAATCSQKCSGKAWRQRQAARRRKKPPAPPVTLTCQQCGTTFTKPATARHAKYCSPECRRKAAYQRRKTKRTGGPPQPTTSACDHCGQPFTYQRKGQPRRYCSKRCADAAFKQRQQSQQPDTPPDPPIPANNFPWGHCHGPAIAAATVPPLECAICGRLKQDDAPGWRVRAYRYSPRRDYLILCICPAHYRPGEPAPHVYGDSSHWR